MKKKKEETMIKSYYNIFEILVSIYAVENGRLQILLKKKQKEPYKDYWILAGDILLNDESIEEKVEDIVLDTTGLPCIYKEQSKIFSNLNRDSVERIIACNYLAVTLKQLVKSNSHEIKWFDINELPPMAYDHKKVVKVSNECIKHQIISNSNDILFKLFPDTFTLPELQSFFESVSNETLDRRNFRKKMVTEKIVIATGEFKVKDKGRPSKLYQLNKKKRREI